MIKTTVGLIANPASGKDIRRLVAHGTVFDNQEKINIVRRIILACFHSGVARILYMPDYHGLVPKAISGLGSDYPKIERSHFKGHCPANPLWAGSAQGEDNQVVLLKRRDENQPLLIEPVAMTLTATQTDSMVAAQLMEEAGCGSVVVLGGDGTSRQVAKGIGRVPILPISTGTNNVFPFMVEATTAGLAASVVAAGQGGDGAVYRAKRLVIIKNGEPVDIALVDAVVTGQSFIGSRALWEVDNMLEAAFTRGEADNIGLASVVGKTRPVGPHDQYGAWVTFRPGGCDVFAPIAPGLFKSVGLAAIDRLEMGQERQITNFPALIALDGEREVELSENDRASIVLDGQGPMVIDYKAALTGAVANGFFTDVDFLNHFN